MLPAKAASTVFGYFVFLRVLSTGISASDWLERLVSEMIYNVLMGTFNPTNSLTVGEHFSRPYLFYVLIYKFECLFVCLLPVNSAQWCSFPFQEAISN